MKVDLRKIDIILIKDENGKLITNGFKPSSAEVVTQWGDKILILNK